MRNSVQCMRREAADQPHLPRIVPALDHCRPRVSNLSRYQLPLPLPQALACLRCAPPRSPVQIRVSQLLVLMKADIDMSDVDAITDA